MFFSEPVYLSSFGVELLAFRCHVVLPGYTHVNISTNTGVTYRQENLTRICTTWENTIECRCVIIVAQFQSHIISYL
jgi:hypothetical protein